MERQLKTYEQGTGKLIGISLYTVAEADILEEQKKKRLDNILVELGSLKAKVEALESAKPVG